MAKMPNSSSRRVKFKKGQQILFINSVCENLHLSCNELADYLGVHRRTFNDWKREAYSMPLPITNKISKISGIPIPSDTKVKDPFWYVYIGARKGALAMHRKYSGMPGDSEYRKRRWREWWDREGRHKEHSIIGKRIGINKPSYSKELAEFTGIMLGDGGITERQVAVTIHSEDDQEFSHYVKDLIERLFQVPVSCFYRRGQKALSLVVSRTELVEYCSDYLGLKIGNKLVQGLDIPDWINKRQEFQKMCLRGLIDTDGCLFFERHKIRGKIYSYPRLNFVTASPLLSSSVAEIFRNLGYSPRVRRNRRAVQLENKAEILHYFHAVSTSNPKHKRRLLLS